MERKEIDNLIDRYFGLTVDAYREQNRYFANGGDKYAFDDSSRKFEIEITCNNIKEEINSYMSSLTEDQKRIENGHFIWKIARAWQEKTDNRKYGAHFERNYGIPLMRSLFLDYPSTDNDKICFLQYLITNRKTFFYDNCLFNTYLLGSNEEIARGKISEEWEDNIANKRYNIIYKKIMGGNQGNWLAKLLDFNISANTKAIDELYKKVSALSHTSLGFLTRAIIYNGFSKVVGNSEALSRDEVVKCCNLYFSMVDKSNNRSELNPDILKKLAYKTDESSGKRIFDKKMFAEIYSDFAKYVGKNSKVKDILFEHMTNVARAVFAQENYSMQECQDLLETLKIDSSRDSVRKKQLCIMQKNLWYNNRSRIEEHEVKLVKFFGEMSDVVLPNASDFIDTEEYNQKCIEAQDAHANGVRINLLKLNSSIDAASNPKVAIYNVAHAYNRAIIDGFAKDDSLDKEMINLFSNKIMKHDYQPEEVNILLQVFSDDNARTEGIRIAVEQNLTDGGNIMVPSENKKETSKETPAIPRRERSLEI